MRKWVSIFIVGPTTSEKIIGLISSVIWQILSRLSPTTSALNLPSFPAVDNLCLNLVSLESLLGYICNHTNFTYK